MEAVWSSSFHLEHIEGFVRLHWVSESSNVNLDFGVRWYSTLEATADFQSISIIAST